MRLASLDSGRRLSSYGRELLEEYADLVGGKPLVGDPSDGGELLGAGRRAGPRHHRLLVPAEHARRPSQVDDLGEALLEFLEPLLHRPRAASRPRQS